MKLMNIGISSAWCKTIAPMDPQQLLKALNPLLGPTGAILGPTEAVRIASLMKDATKLVSKCIYINILKIETTKDTLEKFMSRWDILNYWLQDAKEEIKLNTSFQGFSAYLLFMSVSGWDTLNDWLQDAKEDDNNPLLVEILKVYQQLPVSVDILKKNNAAKTIKQLCKAENESVKTLAFNIFDEWMKKVKGNNNNNNNNDSKVKKKKKDKDRDRSKEEDNSKEEKTDKKDSERKSDHHRSSSSSSSSSSSRDHKHSHNHSHHRHHSGSHRDKDRDRDRRSDDSDKSKDKSDNGDGSSSKSDKSGEDMVSVHKGEGLKLTIKIGGDTSPGRGEVTKKRASTVKRPPSKFRSTGLEEQTMPSKVAKTSSTDSDSSKSTVPKRTGSDMKSELPIKRSRLHMPPPLSVPLTTTVTTPTSTSPQSPSELHGKIKLIPARPRPNHEIHESSGFMDSLETSSATRTYGAFKKKKKLAAAAAAASGSNKGPSTPTTPPSPVSPTTAIARSLPSVPSFYKDTQQEVEPSPEKEIKSEVKTERSPSPTEEATSGEVTQDEHFKTEADQDIEEGRERSVTPEFREGAESKETKGLLTTGATKMKKKKKSVRFKEDHELREFFFFELDETERENVNRPKDFNLAKKQEMMQDRRAMESARRLINDNMIEQLAWYRPRIVMGVKFIESGKDSIEKSVQRLREQGVLQALFFNRNMLPDGPQEPDQEHFEPTEVKLIPLEDVSGGDEFLYNYDQHASVVTTQPPSVDLAPPMPAISGPPPGGPPQNMPLNLPPGSLPPDLMNLLAQFQQQNQNANDPVINQVHQILNSFMCGGQGPNFDQLQQIQQIIGSQMGGMPPDGMMQGPPPGMGPMGPMQPQGPPPPMGPRTPLLGSAPPGFLPQRQMPPNRFGPGGPQGNWGQNNMGGPPGGGPPPFGRMRGPRPNRGGRGGGGGGGGPPMPIKRRNVLCRHFSNGSCRMGAECGFLHPGINGPPPGGPGNSEPVNHDAMGT